MNKLKLNRETLRTLQDTAAQEVNGAGSIIIIHPSRFCTMYIGCTSVICPTAF